MGVVDCESRIVVLDAEGASSRMVLVLRARHLVGRSGSGVGGGRMLLVGCSIGASMFVRFAIIIIVVIGISIRGQGQARIESIESRIDSIEWLMDWKWISIGVLGKEQWIGGGNMAHTHTHKYTHAMRQREYSSCALT